MHSEIVEYLLFIKYNNSYCLSSTIIGPRPNSEQDEELTVYEGDNLIKHYSCL